MSRYYHLRVILGLMERTAGCCGLCGLPVTAATASVDHVIPRSRGGTNDPGNLQLTHEACNNAKTDQLLEELALSVA